MFQSVHNIFESVRLVKKPQVLPNTDDSPDFMSYAHMDHILQDEEGASNNRANKFHYRY